LLHKSIWKCRYVETSHSNKNTTITTRPLYILWTYSFFIQYIIFEKPTRLCLMWFERQISLLKSASPGDEKRYLQWRPYCQNNYISIINCTIILHTPYTITSSTLHIPHLPLHSKHAPTCRHSERFPQTKLQLDILINLKMQNIFANHAFEICCILNLIHVARLENCRVEI